MKKITLLVSLLFLLASCANVNGPEEAAPESTGIDNPALEVVLDKLSGMIGDLYGSAAATRAGGRGFASVTPVSAAATRSADGDMEPLAYIVNFEDDSGFALVSTHPYSDDIIAISNNGNLSLAEFERAYEAVVSEYEAMMAGADTGDPYEGGGCIDDMEDDPEDILYGDEHLPRYPMDMEPDYEPFIRHISDLRNGDDISPAVYFLADYVRTTVQYIQGFHYSDEYGSEGGTTGGTSPTPKWGAWERTGGVNPIIRTKWHQDKPYNNHCPVICGDTTALGCVAVAVGQIATRYRKPDGRNWLIISTFGVYQNGKPYEPEENWDIVAAFTYSVADFLHADFGVNGTSAATSRAAKYFRQKVGLNSVVRHSYKWWRVRDRLDLRCPVYMHGDRSLTSGHAWIVDGYMLQQRNDTRPGYTGNSQSRKLLHLNWGSYRGFLDGYYAEGVFDPSARALEIDTAVGDGGDSSSTSAYTKRLKILTWKQP